jgi:acetylornithine deacetylase/succinyl-diaminopimelate desuccinylase-like protein
VATISTADAEALTTTLNEAAPGFLAEDGEDFSVAVVVTGASAHASEPELGVNPVPRLAAFLLARDVEFVENHHLQALR